MKHPLSNLGYSGSADFDRSGIDKVDADFSAGNVVNASEDFGKQCMSGDFGVDYGEDHYSGGFEGYGHMDHFLGEHDEGLGFKIKKPKFKMKSPAKSIAKVVSSPIKHINAPIKAALTLPKQALKVTSESINKAQQIAQIATVIPGVSQVQAIAQKAAEAVSKTGIPMQAIAPALAPLLPPKASVRAVSESSDTQDIMAPIQVAESSESIVTPEQARSSTSSSEIKVNGNFAHPLLFSHRRMKGEVLSGFLDDLYKKQKKAVQQVIDANKAKITTAATTQLSNVVGKQLDKFTKSDPKAAAAIQSVVSTATETATAKAKQGISDTIKASFDQNKKYIFAVGGGLLALVALKMFMKRKA